MKWLVSETSTPDTEMTWISSYKNLKHVYVVNICISRCNLCYCRVACCMVSLSARVSNNFIIQSSALLSFCLADFSRPFFDSTFFKKHIFNSLSGTFFFFFFGYCKCGLFVWIWHKTSQKLKFNQEPTWIYETTHRPVAALKQYQC